MVGLEVGMIEHSQCHGFGKRGDKQERRRWMTLKAKLRSLSFVFVERGAIARVLGGNAVQPTVRFKKETLGEDPEGHRNGVGTGSLDFGIGGAMEGRDECQVDRKHYYHRRQHSESCEVKS